MSDDIKSPGIEVGWVRYFQIYRLRFEMCKFGRLKKHRGTVSARVGFGYFEVGFLNTNLDFQISWDSE